jgi:hypothetical protein
VLANAVPACSNAKVVQQELVMWFCIKDCKEVPALLLHIIRYIVG